MNEETADWITQPRLIRLVQVILANQYTTPGYTAEAQLGLEMLERFYDVPWDWRRRDALHEDLAAQLEKA